MSDKIEVREIKPSRPRPAAKTKMGDQPVHPNNTIYVRAMKGVFQRLRRYGGWFLMALFMLTPWIPYQGRQAILLDIEAQQFNFFSVTLFPQDLILLAFVFMIAAFALFFFTTFLGRVWCGYTCPQTVWTFIYIWFEEKIEGARNKRVKLDRTAWNFEKLWRKTFKHFCWLAVALVTGITMVAYFVPAPDVVFGLFTGELSFAATFSVIFFMLATYANAGWMRTIVCTHMCPYARFQSAMFDKDTFIVGYDVDRGEARGPRKRKEDYKAVGLGDCVDCNLCVEVCPSGIDIRNGLQYECINCGACIDACDQTMDKMGYEKGLISYTTEHRLAGGTTELVRPKLIGYGLALVVMMIAFVVTANLRVNFEVDVLRDRNQMFRETNEGWIENTYTLVLVNKTQQATQFHLSVEGLPPYEWSGPQQIEVAAGDVADVPISLAVDPYELTSPMTRIEFVVTTDSSDDARRIDSRFFSRR
ncbi:cytochrome c oxidase accessory protein CcoG [Corallincola luteus]|uniref:Cytochrome c oxidase accessory protein CcoG n=1 Tax=Corallincola luteus TaxID=1775177 RepID=A0ABY2AJI7_9GAMM|nr:cytochrome c oxidase accessory protein CcoG [Corallincola luteus]